MHLVRKIAVDGDDGGARSGGGDVCVAYHACENGKNRISFPDFHEKLVPGLQRRRAARLQPVLPVRIIP